MAVFLVLFLMGVSLSACTVFVLNGENDVFVARNLDWPVGEGFVVVNQRGKAKTALPEGPGFSLAWRSRFGSVTFNLLGRGFPLGGMNEKGLVIEEANYSPSRYPRGPGNQVNEFQWIQYHLDTCDTTAAVLKSLKEVAIVPILARVHYMICDASGRAAVVEFIRGRARVYAGRDLVVPVMTNTSYGNSLKSLAIHQGFGGKRTVGNGPESPERFVRAATWVRGLSSLPGKVSPKRAFRVLDAVAQQDTQWRIVYDPVHLEIRFHTLCNPVVRTVHPEHLDFKRSCIAMDINAPGTAPCFQPWSVEKNNRLLARVFDGMVKAKEVSRKEADILLARLINFAGGKENQ